MCLWYFYSRKIEVIFLYYRIEYSHIRLDYKIFADFFVSFFTGTQDKSASGVGCRSPPHNLNFSKKFRLWGKGEWHITTVKKNGNGDSGKRLRKRYWGDTVFQKTSLKQFAFMTGLISIQTDDFRIQFLIYPSIFCNLFMAYIYYIMTMVINYDRFWNG